MNWIRLGHEMSKAGGATPLKDVLTNNKLVKLSPPFDETERPDRRCKDCQYRIMLEGDIADCTLVSHGVSLSKGYCDMWKEGEAAKPEDLSKDRMHYEDAGYAEQPTNVPVICGNCYFYETVDDSRGNCALWMALVKSGQCCPKRKSKEETVPPPHLEKKEAPSEPAPETAPSAP